MYTIIEHIEYLLTSHDCVVIPGWGALVAQYSDSRYNPVAGHIERPRRELGFNASVDHNDGLLAQSLVRREGVTYDEAMRQVGLSVSAFKRQLALGNEVPLGRLGYFHSTDGHRIEFTPFDHEQSNDGYYGLRDLNISPLVQEVMVQDEPAAVRATVRRPSWGARIARVAASIAVLLCLTVLLSTPVIVNRNQQDYASLNLPTVTKPQRQVIETKQATPAQPAQPAVATAATPAAPASPLLLDEGGKCLLVVASLNSMKQVEEFKQSHPDLASKMQVSHSSSKLYHVYVARSSSVSHLYALRSELPEAYRNSSWVKN